MMRSKLVLAGMFTLVLGLFTVLPADTSAQGWWGQDRRDDRRERRDERRERQRERREERRERRQERRDDRWDDGVWNQGRYGGSDRWDDRWNQGRSGEYDRYGRNNGRYDNYPNYGGSYEARQTALNAGYNEGIKEGRRDRERGERFDYRDESAYRNATKDYSSRHGDRGIYQRYFREAFARGYNDGYRGY